MISVKSFLAACGLKTPHDRIKLVRHVDHASMTVAAMIRAGEFEFYQAEQSAARKPFHDCETIVSFIASPDGKAAFHGVYQVHGSRPFTAKDHAKAPAFLKESLRGKTDRIWYELEELPGFDDLRGTLIVRWDWGISWVRKKDVEVFELLPKGRVKNFPGYQEVILSWQELKDIVNSPESHRDWVTALKFTAAIYRIVDGSTGMTYIGSAYGKDGLWNRFCDYARTGHGNNKKLMGLDADKFQWSIVRTLSGVMAKAEVIRLEHLEMQKHGSKKSSGLNH